MSGRLRNASASWMPCVALAACGILASCCSTPVPPADRYFDRHSVSGTMRGFVYAIDTHQWAYAYESLTAGSREEVGRLRFEVAIRFLSEPRTKVPLYDLISSALDIRGRPRYSPLGELALVKVVARGRDDDGKLILIPVYLHFAREDGEWRLDLLRSLGVETARRATRELTGDGLQTG